MIRTLVQLTMKSCMLQEGLERIRSLFYQCLIPGNRLGA